MVSLPTLRDARERPATHHKLAARTELTRPRLKKLAEDLTSP